MRARPLALLVLLLLGAPLAAWLWSEHAREAPVLVPGARDASSAPAGDGAALSTSGDPSARKPTSELASANGARFHPNSTGTPGWHALDLVRKDAREPVADADVFVLEQPTQDWTLTGGSYPMLAPDLERHLEQHGRKFHSDARGRVLVPEPRESLAISARKDELWGWANLRHDAEEPFALELAPMHELGVRVVDARERPVAGARVHLSLLDDPITRWTDSTDVNGELVVRNVEALLQDLELEGQPLARLGLEDVFDPPLERWLDARALPRETIVFRLPETGALRVRIVDDGGRVLPAQGNVYVYLQARGGEDEELVSMPKLVPHAALVRGEALFPSVVPGNTLEVRAIFEGGASTRRVVDGPRHADEEVRVDLPLSPKDTLLSLRLVDEVRKPLAGVSLEWARYWARPDLARMYRTSRAQVHTDADGRFTWVLERETQNAEDGEPQRRFGYLWLVRRDAAALTAELDLQGPFPTGLLDLGEIVLKPSVPLVTGRVIDEYGAPIREANVALSRLVAGSPLGIPGLWPQRTDDDGRFTFRGPCLGFDLVLQVSAADYTELPGAKRPEFRCGTSPDFEIRLRLLGRLRGRVLSDAWIGDAQLGFALAKSDGRPGPPPQLERTRDGYAFEFRGLSAGSWRLNIGDFQSGALEVRAGETCCPPELDPIDLRGKLGVPDAADEPAIEVRVLDDAGRALERGRAWMKHRDHIAEASWTDGRLFVRPGTLEELLVWSPGHCVQHLAAPTQPTEVRLRPALRARFVLAVPQDLRAPTKVVELAVTGMEALDPALQLALVDDHPPVRFDEDGSCTLRFAAACEVSLALFVRDLAQRSAGSREITFAQEPHFTVREADGEQRFEIQVSEEAWAILREELKAMR